MKKSRYTDSQIMAILKQAEAGTPVPELCREHGRRRFTVRLHCLVKFRIIILIFSTGFRKCQQFQCFMG